MCYLELIGLASRIESSRMVIYAPEGRDPSRLGLLFRVDGKVRFFAFTRWGSEEDVDRMKLAADKLEAWERIDALPDLGPYFAFEKEPQP